MASESSQLTCGLLYILGSNKAGSEREMLVHMMFAARNILVQSLRSSHECAL